MPPGFLLREPMRKWGVLGQTSGQRLSKQGRKCPKGQESPFQAEGLTTLPHGSSWMAQGVGGRGGARPALEVEEGAELGPLGPVFWTSGTTGQSAGSSLVLF